jgi:hypothetical protein
MPCGELRSKVFEELRRMWRRELANGLIEQPVFYLGYTDLAKTVDKIIPWDVGPADPRNKRDDPADFQMIGDDPPAADQKCRQDLRMTA